MNNESTIGARLVAETERLKEAQSAVASTIENDETLTKTIEIPQKYWLDVSEEFKGPEFILRYNGVGFCPIGDIQAIRGMEGNGKSFLATMFVSAVLKGDYCGLTCDKKDAKVLYVDTEQHKNNVLAVARRVHRLCGWKAKEANDRFKVLMFREEESIEKRVQYLWKAIMEFQPDYVLIDGAADLVDNVNDRGEVVAFIAKCMAQASMKSMAITTIIHQNYGSEKMQGWLGTQWARKASDVFSCQKIKEMNTIYFKVEQVKARNKDIQDFQFIVSDDETKLGIPMITTPVDTEADTPTNRGERDDLMREIFSNKKTICKTEVINSIIAKRLVSNSDEAKRKAKVWFDQAVDWGIIKFDSHSRLYSYVGLNADPFGDSPKSEEPVQGSLPF